MMNSRERIYDLLENNLRPELKTPAAIAKELNIKLDAVIVYMTMWYQQRGVKVGT